MPARNSNGVESRLAAAPPSRLMPPKRESDRLLERVRTFIHVNVRGRLDGQANRPANATAAPGGPITSFAHDAKRGRPVQLGNDAYLGWREHCTRVTLAYRSWVDADWSKAEQAWEAYEDALALEEIAASRYAERAARVERVGLLSLDPATRR
ncbi:MAG TPA: hypothetical protein VK721_15985 [Solirubrobacteraceae bacterium]|jgi:hypothetical protein|nr:hypothetical protein [Solirubrobacteraceae bacterium]